MKGCARAGSTKCQFGVDDDVDVDCVELIEHDAMSKGDNRDIQPATGVQCVRCVFTTNNKQQAKVSIVVNV